MNKNDPRVNWEEAKSLWYESKYTTIQISRQIDVAAFDIEERARVEKWPRRGSPSEVKAAEAEKVSYLKLVEPIQYDGHPGKPRDAEEVVIRHRDDILRLHGMKRFLMNTLDTYLQTGVLAQTPLIEKGDSVFDILNKIIAMEVALIKLERQAYNIDEETEQAAVGIVVDQDVDNLSDDELYRQYQEAIRLSGSIP